MSDSVRPHRWQPTRLHRPWDSPGKNTGVGCHFLLQCMKVKSESEVTQSCPTLSNLIDCSPPGSSIHGIFQARVLEWGAIAFSEEEDKFRSDCILWQTGTVFTRWSQAHREFKHWESGACGWDRQWPLGLPVMSTDPGKQRLSAQWRLEGRRLGAGGGAPSEAPPAYLARAMWARSCWSRLSQ